MPPKLAPHSFVAREDGNLEGCFLLSPSQVRLSFIPFVPARRGDPPMPNECELRDVVAAPDPRFRGDEAGT